ncbi:hypothetical protein O3M35_010633 [Rhynocoris fuscipes]|uniref:Uncharacterized protein n=1 Tax=Rhynocoris fuscipes TaxID=488301 RepID=A0AAW1D531_9HEMI
MITGARNVDSSIRKKPLRRGGCSAFGHSCFGGHGKRSDEFMLQFQPRTLQRIPPPDIVRQWIKSYHSANSALE